MENNTQAPISPLSTSKNSIPSPKSNKQKIITIVIVVLVILLLLNILSKSKDKTEDNIETPPVSVNTMSETDDILNMMSAAANSVRQSESISNEIKVDSQKEILESFSKTGLK